MKKSWKVEFFINGKFLKRCAYGRWNESYNTIIRQLKRRGYFKVWTDNMPEIDDETEVFANLKKMACVTLTHKIWSGKFDKKGNKVYEGDIVLSPLGNKFEVWLTEDSCYTLWASDARQYVYNFDEYVKVNDCRNFTKDNWNCENCIGIKEV